ncbi:DUF3592 domain-containing protein [Hymenobacter sp. UYCo722]|uniref:DUF3592 domain-containing protein n=1 Tax=Hymenobacter sp. UYCo722 TaxID=3156335 RepID=UPI003393816B
MTEDQQPTKLFFYCFYFVIVLTSGGFLSIGISEAYHSYTLYNSGLHTQGKAVLVEDRGNADGDWTTYEVTFVAADHNTYTIQNHYSTSDEVKLYKVGQPVPIIYLAAEPEDGRIDNSREQSGVYGGCFFGALFAVLFGGVFYYFFHRPHLLCQRAA